VYVRDGAGDEQRQVERERQRIEVRHHREHARDGTEHELEVAQSRVFAVVLFVIHQLRRREGGSALKGDHHNNIYICGQIAHLDDLIVEQLLHRYSVVIVDFNRLCKRTRVLVSIWWYNALSNQ
jgi:hypothetical protein